MTTRRRRTPAATDAVSITLDADDWRCLAREVGPGVDPRLRALRELISAALTRTPSGPLAIPAAEDALALLASLILRVGRGPALRAARRLVIQASEHAFRRTSGPRSSR